VNRGYCALLGIDEKNGDAIGGLDAEEKAGSFCEGSVAFAGFFGRRSKRPDYGRVDLFEIDERKFLGTEGRLEFFAIFEDVFVSVPVGEAEIKDFFSKKIGGAAGGGAETVE